MGGPSRCTTRLYSGRRVSLEHCQANSDFSSNSLFEIQTHSTRHVHSAFRRPWIMETMPPVSCFMVSRPSRPPSGRVSGRVAQQWISWPSYARPRSWRCIGSMASGHSCSSLSMPAAPLVPFAGNSTVHHRLEDMLVGVADRVTHQAKA